MSKRKILALALTVAMIAILAVGGSLAYFTDKEEATNTFTVGNVNITLTEPNWEGEGKEDAPEVYPGEALAKDPIVTNVGSNPCFVRVQVTGLDCLNEVGAGDIVYRTDGVIGKLGDGWVDGGDGYFYYATVMEKNAVTDALFDHIVIPADLENLTENAAESYDVDVKAEAVQAQGARPGWDKPEGNELYPGVLQLDASKPDHLAILKAWFATCQAE